MGFSRPVFTVDIRLDRCGERVAAGGARQRCLRTFVVARFVAMRLHCRDLAGAPLVRFAS
jgi:hypothetical protein